VLDDGTTQLRQFTYDTTRAFKLTQSIDPLGRVTGWSYPNHIDLAAVTQGTAYGFSDTLAQISYNIHHRPILVTGPDSQTTSYMYNAAGQVTSTTNALGQTTQFQYNATSDLTSVINANGIAAATYTYDAFDRVATFTDSEGWTVACTYDPANRITGITYPDGTAETNTYRNLDLISHTDRQGRTWTYSYDADRRLISGTDPAGQQTLRGYDPSGRLTSLTDPKGNVTAWTYDIEGRLTAKTYADSSTLTTTYENTTSRVYAVADALGQTKQYTYAEDDNPIGVNYLNAVNATPNVSFTWDPFYPRPTAMTDGTGTTTYTYVPVGSDGALQRQQETPPLAGAAITYGYDALGRLASRTASGAGTETFAYDAIGRVVTHTSDLGSFTLTYLGQTGQVAGRSLSGSSLATNWSYLPNSGDRRLAGITNVGLSSGQTSSYQYTTTPENFISGITETSDQPIPAPPVVQQSATYNNLNQLTTLSGQTLTSDAAGTLTYTWDAENRLIGIGYPGQPGKATAFTYDGLGRRVAISSTPAGGGSATTTSYIWCGLSPCQARNAAGAPVRGYYAEGEMVSGSPVYYGVDQLGSVRRAFANAGSAPAYEFDPYGNPLQTTPPLTDYGYAGMMYNADSGLYLTPFRAYDPVSGRWLSRDPIGENGGLNLYAYVNNDPLNVTDPSGMIPNGFSASAMGVDGCGGGVSGGGAWSIIPAQLVIPGMGVPPPPGTVATDSLDQSAQALSNAITNAVHGNSLDSQSRTYVYQLVDQTTGETLKYGITSNLIPQNRYSQTFYDATNSQMQVLSSWSNRGFARAVELGYTGGYFITNGQLPPLSKVP
jgi:RHS repeat-associated protein